MVLSSCFQEGWESELNSGEEGRSLLRRFPGFKICCTLLCGWSDGGVSPCWCLLLLLLTVLPPSVLELEASNWTWLLVLARGAGGLLPKKRQHQWRWCIFTNVLGDSWVFLTMLQFSKGASGGDTGEQKCTGPVDKWETKGIKIHPLKSFTWTWWVDTVFLELRW